MMELKLVRTILTPQSTIGELYVDGIWECYSLEDCVREGPKILGETAIPEGRYEVVIDMSARFQRLMPHILNVPDFEGIRIHSGNTEADTRGCVLVGRSKLINTIVGSQRAFLTLFAKLKDGLKAGKAFIEIGHDNPGEEPNLWP
jgi:hypothetical protein